MDRAWMFLWGAAALCVGACATSTASTRGNNDGDAGDIPIYDAGNASTDGRISTACTLGTPDHCGACGTACPGVDDDGTQRTCSDSTPTATCDFICKGEWYDLDGDAANGCEAQDPIVHDSAEAGVPEVATTAGFTVGAPDWLIYDDARTHDAPPLLRPLGREDWYTLSNPDGRLKVCLSIANFPSDDQFEVCVTNIGNQNIEASQCKSVMPSSGSLCVQPASSSNGAYWVRVRKIAGSNTTNGYALFLQD